MENKDKVLKIAGDKYSCLESFEVVTIKNDSDDLVLSCEVGEDELAVSVIDSNDGSLIDNYSTECDAECLEDKLNTAVATFENIQKLKKNNKLKVKKESKEDESSNESTISEEDKELIKKAEDIDDLSKDEIRDLKQLCEDDKLDKDQLTSLLEGCLDSLLESDDKEVLTEEEKEDGEAVNVEISEETLDNIPCDKLVSNVIDRLDTAKEETEDETSKVILDDISLQLDGIKEELVNLEVE